MKEIMQNLPPEMRKKLMGMMSRMPEERREGFKKKLEDAATAEGFYEYTLYLIFSMLNIYVRTQVKCAKGRTDMVVWMPHTTYVFELKTNGTARQALEQIETNQYALPYQAFGRQVVKIGCKFNVETRTLEDWLIKAD